MENSAAYDDAKRAIDDVFSDTSVEPEDTARFLKWLRQEIDDLLDVLRSDGVDVNSVF